MADLYAIGREDIKTGDLFVAETDTWVTNLHRYYFMRAVSQTKSGNWRMEFLVATRTNTVNDPLETQTRVELAQPVQTQGLTKIARWSEKLTRWGMTNKKASGFDEKLIIRQRHTPGLRLQESWYSR